MLLKRLVRGALPDGIVASDTHRDRKHRMLVWHTSSLALALVTLFIAVANGAMRHLYMTISMSIIAGVAVCSLLAIRCCHPVSNTLVLLPMWGYTLGIVICDIYNASKDVTRVWPILIVFMDLLLVFRVNEFHTRFFMGAIAAYLLAVQCEYVFGYGLFDLPGTPSQSMRWSGKCDCGQLPCGVTLWSGLLLAAGQLFIFLMDFSFTRGFANQVLQEKGKMEAAIQAANSISGHLADFDLDAAAETLEESRAQLPPELEATLLAILQNLRRYRPYIPDAVFQQSSPELSCGPSAPPGASGSAALVFTDIKGSTALWESAPEAMKRSLKIHNQTIRSVIRSHEGYEVKTIGDAFMVAFSDATHAANFALSVQDSLLRAPWPPGLLHLPQCARDTSGLWGGITVRIGVNSGCIASEENELTGRMDYFGHPVNTAARLEGKCPPGCVALPASLYAQIEREGVLSPHACKPLGALSLAGVADPLPAVCIAPESLAARCSSRRHAADCSRLPPQVLPEDTLLSCSLPLALTRCPPLTAAAASIAQGLTETPCATLAAVRIACEGHAGLLATERVNAVLATLLTAAGRTDGTPGSLLGAVMTVGWNAGAVGCWAHIEASLKFATLCAAPRGSLLPFSVGLSSGSVTTGNVGTSGQKFMMVAGACVDTAVELSTAAQSAPAYGYYVPLTDAADLQARQLSHAGNGCGILRDPSAGEGDGAGDSVATAAAAAGRRLYTLRPVQGDKVGGGGCGEPPMWWGSESLVRSRRGMEGVGGGGMNSSRNG